MKLTIKEIAPAAQLLAQAKCSTLNDNEFNATLKMANVICPILDDVQKKIERIRESAKPNDWDEVVALFNKAKKEGISAEESERVNKTLADYNGKVNKAIAEIEGESYDINIDLLPADVPAKLLRENNWAFGAIADLKMITKKE